MARSWVMFLSAFLARSVTLFQSSIIGSFMFHDSVRMSDSISNVVSVALDGSLGMWVSIVDHGSLMKAVSVRVIGSLLRYVSIFQDG